MDYELDFYKGFDSYFSSLLRHHPSAVSCDDSDLLLEESCVMDISTEVLYFLWIWLYDRWTILYEFLRMDMIRRQYGCPIRGKGLTPPHFSWCESSDAFITICLKTFGYNIDMISMDMVWIELKWKPPHRKEAATTLLSWYEPLLRWYVSVWNV